MFSSYKVGSDLKIYLRIIFLFVVAAFAPLLWLVVLPLRLLVIFLLGRDESNEKLLTFDQGIIDEDFVKLANPRGSVAATLELDGDITVAEMRKLFRDSVLEAEILSSNGKLVKRYPELKQYFASILCFRFRKNDLDFNLDYHIRERLMDEEVIDLSILHEQLLNETFRERKSPWELVVIRNVILSDDLQENRDGKGRQPRKTILALRMHHLMGDAKSFLKLVVECLGNKELRTAKAHDRILSLPRKLVFCVTFPIHYLLFLATLLFIGLRYARHPWKVEPNVKGRMFVRFSKKIQIDDLKMISKSNNVLTSSTIISIVSGAMRNVSNSEEWSGGVACAYILPKANHPPTLANHVDGSGLILPADEGSPLTRLRKSNTRFKMLDSREFSMCGDFFAYFLGSLPFSVKSANIVNHLCPLGFSNIAGEIDDFSIGGVPCSGFRLTCGCMPGSQGLSVIIFSFKDTLRVGVTACETVFKSALELEKLTEEIGKEVELLKTLSSRKSWENDFEPKSKSIN